MGQLVVLSECVCPGGELKLECTVVGAGFTVWRGTVFDCISNQIVLRHSRFMNGMAMGVCNNGDIIGRSVNKLSSDLNFTSQLTVQLDVDATQEGRTVECVYHDVIQNGEIVIGTYTIVYTTGKLMKQ